jgi:cytochrome P450
MLPRPDRLFAAPSACRGRNRQPGGHHDRAIARDPGLATLSTADTVAVLRDVLAPNLAKGVIIRRPRVVGVAERLGLDRRAVRRMQRLRERYGSGPLRLRVPLREQVLILDPADVRRVLEGEPEPFSTATQEKRAALAHFEPKGALITRGEARGPRRRLNERVLGHENPVHALAPALLAVVAEEADDLLRHASSSGALEWDPFFDTWMRVVRRAVFGDGARDDRELTDLMERLRSHGNWAFLAPRRERLRNRLFERMRVHFERAEPGSLAGAMAAAPRARSAAPLHQIPQWLFAFDPAGMTTFRALALASAHPEFAASAAAEVAAAEDPAAHPLPALRAAILESLRLWPTTPMILRETTAPTDWAGGTLPEGTGVLIFANFFHRDDLTIPFADRFAPEIWAADSPVGDWPLVPFSGGPAICPGRNVVLLLTSAMLGRLIRGGARLDPADQLRADRPLPATLSPYTLRFRIEG